MTPDEARNLLEEMLDEREWLIPARHRNAVELAIEAFDRNVDLKRKHDEVNAANGYLVRVTRHARGRRNWLVRYAWKQRRLLKEAHAWVREISDEIVEEKRKVDALLRANARLERQVQLGGWKDEFVLTENGIRFARPVPDSELRGAVVHLVHTAHPGDGLPVRPNRVLVNGQDVGLLKDPPKVDAGGKELTTVTLVLLPSKVIIGDAAAGRCWTCLDTGRVAEQAGLDSFTSVPCPDCLNGRPATSGDAA